MVSHVLEPKQGAVGGSKEQTLEGGRILGPQARIHQLSLPLYQGLLCRLFLLLKLMARLLLGLADRGKKMSGECQECCIPLIIYVCILVVSSLCCFRLGPLHHWSPPPALQRQASGSSVPHPRRNLLPPAAWRVPLSCVSPAERERRCNLFPRFWIMILLYQIHGDLHDCKKY